MKKGHITEVIVNNMAFIKINDKLKKRGKPEIRIVPQAIDGAKYKVLIGTCTHCAKLRDNMLEAMNKLNIPQNELETIDDLITIARMGIVATPALIIDSKLVSVGKLLSVDEIIKIIEREIEDGTK